MGKRGPKAPNGGNTQADTMNLDNAFPDVNFEVDFDTGDFDFMTEGAEDFTQIQAQENVRIMRPRLDVTTMQHTLMFENAEEFAKQISLAPGSRTFAWLSGSFIFGDIVEALMTARNVTIKKLYIASLSFSQDSIGSLRNIIDYMGDELEAMVLIFSGYQYSHEKFGLVPYMYRTLDNPRNNVQIAFGGWHCKLITLETVYGNTITIHGSANLRSSNSVEQVMVEINNHELHDFNAKIMQNIVDRFGTINKGAPYKALKRIEGKAAWQISKIMAEEGET